MCDTPTSQSSDDEQENDASSGSPKGESSGRLDEGALEALADTVFSQCSQDALMRLVGIPFAEARVKYVVSSVAVQSEEEFLEKACAFYLHVLAHTGRGSVGRDDETMRANVLSLLGRAFERSGGWRGACEQGLSGRHGGMRIVFDMMADQLTDEARTDQIKAVFSEYFDPLDDASKSALLQKLIERGDPCDGTSLV